MAKDSESQVWASFPRRPNSYIWFSLWLPIVLEINSENSKEWNWCHFPRKGFLSSFYVCCVTFPGERWTSSHLLSIRPGDVWESWVQCEPMNLLGLLTETKVGVHLTAVWVTQRSLHHLKVPPTTGDSFSECLLQSACPLFCTPSISQDCLQLGCRKE